MSRIVLLGLSEEDVDVLSRISREETRPEVVVAHPDPTALVLQLASLADFSTTTSLPAARADDVVVIPTGDSTQIEEWIETFRRAGAKIVSPQALVPVPGTPAIPETPVIPVIPMIPKDEKAPVSDSTVSAHPSGNGAGGESPSVDSVVPTAKPTATPQIQERSTMQIESPPVDIWSDPGATFKYLIERSLGRNQATLWWDGAMGVWVPWMRTGESPVSNEKSVIELPSTFGSFRLTGTWSDADAVPVNAITRVAEDIALRDLAMWQQAAAKLPGLKITRDPDAFREWGEPVFEALNPETAWMWEKTPEGWKLRVVYGQDLSFSGELTVSERMMEALFAGDELHWERWRPGEHVSIQLGFSPGDGCWPLRWERVKKALSEKR